MFTELINKGRNGMLYFFNDETTNLYYDLFDRLLSILTRFNPDTAEANFEDIIDKIILLYPNTEDSLTRFIPSFTPLTHYQDKILNCLFEFNFEGATLVPTPLTMLRNPSNTNSLIAFLTVVLLTL